MLASGSSGNAIYIGTQKHKILVDAGLSGAEINRRLQEIEVDLADLDAILLTHEHSDHISGAGVLARRCDLPIYATEGTWQAGAEKLGKLRSEQQFICSEVFAIGELNIKSFTIPHDAQEPVGYTIRYQGHKVAVATDMGVVTEEVKEEVAGAQLVVLEANHDLEMLKIGPYPWSLKKRVMSPKGHLSNDDAAALAVELAQQEANRILLAHLSQDNNIPELAFLTIKNMLVEQGLKLGGDVVLNFAQQDSATAVYQVG
ncbi:MBL fold metallo-hydrolase [Halanaerobaculum tunisiense]